MTALLACAFALAFILSPYWMLAQSTVARIALLALTTGVGAVWCYLSGAELEIRSGVERKTLVFFGIIFAGMAVLNYRPLTSDIPWRGDESTHIGITIALAEKEQVWVFPVLFAAALLLYIAWRKSKWAAPVGVLIIAAVAFFILAANPLQGIEAKSMLRYPLVNYWLFSLAPKIAMLAANPYYEALYRIIPFLAAVVVVWIFQKNLAHSGSPLAILWGLSIVVLPLVFYYSSVLYLEMPAAALMLVVCFDIKSLLKDDFAQIKRNPAWYALILIGFIKDTTITFLLCFILCRAVIFLLRLKAANLFGKEPGDAPGWKTAVFFKHYLAGELGILLSTLLPYALYLFFRSVFTSSRGFMPQAESLLNPMTFYAVGRSFVEQFGLSLLFFLGGCALLIKRREYTAASFFLLLFIFIPLFHAVDRRGIYAGYSRFNLFLLPAILAGSSVLINQITEHKKIIGTAAACAIMAANLLISPVYLDGSKKPLWGNYNSDTSEHYYPYQNALSWLKEVHGDERILFTGMYYDYYFDFYFNKLDWHPEHEILMTPWDTQNEAELISDKLAEAEKKDFRVVLYHVRGKNIPQPQETGRFHQEKVFRNKAHALLVFSIKE